MSMFGTFTGFQCDIPLYLWLHTIKSSLDFPLFHLYFFFVVTTNNNLIQITSQPSQLVDTSQAWNEHCYGYTSYKLLFSAPQNMPGQAFFCFKEQKNEGKPPYSVIQWTKPVVCRGNNRIPVFTLCCVYIGYNLFIYTICDVYIKPE